MYKDSGVEWVEKLPTDWQVKRLKEMLCEVVYGTSEKTKESGRYEVLGMGDIDEGKVSFPKKKLLMIYKIFSYLRKMTCYLTEQIV